MAIVIEREEIKLLAEVGMLAATQADLTAARAIFAAIEQERPDAAAAYAGLALAYLFRGRSEEAVECLQRGLLAVPSEEQSDLQAFLVLAFEVEGRRADSERALRAAEDHPFALAVAASVQLAQPGG